MGTEYGIDTILNTSTILGTNTTCGTGITLGTAPGLVPGVKFWMSTANLEPTQDWALNLTRRYRVE